MVGGARGSACPSRARKRRHAQCGQVVQQFVATHTVPIRFVLLVPDGCCGDRTDDRLLPKGNPRQLSKQPMHVKHCVM